MYSVVHGTYFVLKRMAGRLAVPQYDVIPLQLIPMLVGFFTYKAATLVETFKELLPKQDEVESSP